MQKESGCNNNGANNNWRLRREGRRERNQRMLLVNFSATVATMAIIICQPRSTA